MKPEKFEKILSVEMTYQLSKLCFMMGAALLMFTFAAGLGGCKSNVSNGTKNSNTEIETGVSSVEGGVSMLLSPETRTIEIRVLTSDGSAINVEGCSGSIIDGGDFSKSRTLTAKGERIVLKGKITKLQCDNNQLTSLNVQGCSELEWLYCWQNQLTTLDVQGLTALTELECHENQLTLLNVQGCSALTYLSCGDNQLTSLDVNALNALEELYCYANQLTSLNVQGCSALEKIVCRTNKLGSSAFIKLFDDLPASGGECYIYLDDKSEGNHKNFNAPEKLKQAFNKAKTEKNWTMYKYEEDWSQTEI